MVAGTSCCGCVGQHDFQDPRIIKEEEYSEHQVTVDECSKGPMRETEECATVEIEAEVRGTCDECSCTARKKRNKRTEETV